MSIQTNNRLQSLKQIQLTRPGRFLFRSWSHLYRSRFPYQELAPLTSIESSLLSNNSVIHGLVDNRSKQWAGFTLLEFYSSSTLLAYLATNPDFENQGLARKLVNAQLEKYLTEKSPYFWLEANPKLWSFYKKLGFQRLPIPYVIPEFYGAGTEFMGLFVKTHVSVTKIPKTVIHSFVSDLLLSGYGIKDSDVRYKQQMKTIQDYPQTEFDVENRD
ncbi:MAG TPA: N-acetyltransferase [Thiomicrospira sp.]|jgi:GNAT superfamily N-acetyltransferase|nr:N-acetyltransferase [Thiomicrospira sp.]